MPLWGGRRQIDPEGYECRIGALWARALLRKGWALAAFGKIWFKREEDFQRYLREPWWRAHEHHHIWQLQHKFGGRHFAYLAAFVWEYVRFGHAKAPLELEANRAADQAIAEGLHPQPPPHSSFDEAMAGGLHPQPPPLSRSSKKEGARGEQQAGGQVDSKGPMASPAASPTRLQPLVDADAIQRRIAELARQIREDYGDDPILFLCILKGSFMFLADLCRHFGDDVRLEFMRVSSYGEETRSSGVVQILQDVDHPLEGKNVLVVEDIVDTGATLRHLRELLALRNPKSLKVVALLNKAAARTVQVDVEYVGFDIPNEFVVGYGLDVAEKYRNLPYVAVLDQERTS